MQLEKIVTQSSAKHHLRFTLMERSLRAVGCSLPIWVIPFDDEPIKLPKNSQIWRNEELIDWTRSNGGFRKRKYQCLTTANYQYADTDIVFLRNPETVLTPHSGVVVACNHWTLADGLRVVTKESRALMRQRSTLWQKNIFCAGQFACDSALYTTDELVKTAMQPGHKATCVDPPFGDQEGTNLLVFLSQVPITNLTLPPYCMESTWVGDYDSDDPLQYWSSEERKPYLLHFYCHTHRMAENRPIYWLFRELLTKGEQKEWIEQSQAWCDAQAKWDVQRESFHQRSPLQKAADRIKRAGLILMRGYD